MSLQMNNSFQGQYSQTDKENAATVRYDTNPCRFQVIKIYLCHEDHDDIMTFTLYIYTILLRTLMA